MSWGKFIATVGLFGAYSFLRNNKNKNVACSLDFINSPCNSA